MKCEKHPRYRGKRPPRSDCATCWGIWHVLQEGHTPEDDAALRQKREELSQTKKRYNQLQEDKERLERELEAVKAISDVRVHKIKNHKADSKSEVVPVIVVSDLHIEETVESTHTNGLNEYNLKIAQHRVERIFQRSKRLLDIFGEHSVINDCVLALLGDYYSGNIHEELLENCSLQPIHAAMKAQQWLASGIQYLLDNTDLRFTIPCHSGNHARITSGRRYATEQGNSLEYFIHHNLANHFRNEPRLKFVISDGYHSYLDVHGFTVRFHHGHAIRFNGNVGGPTVTIRKKIMAWNKAKKADLDVFGHLHGFMTDPYFVMNGSAIGWNDFAQFHGFDYQVPSQTFFIIDVKRKMKGLVAPIFLD